MKPPTPPGSVRPTQIPVRISVPEGYRLWSRTYDSDPNPLLAIELRTLADRLINLEGKVFLDVGCGTGRWMARAAARGAKSVGVDLSFEMLAEARCKAQLAGRLIQADGCGLPLRDHFADMVMSSFSLGYTGCLERSIRELSRVARLGARVVVSDLHPRACQMGWRRSFRNASTVYEIESCFYTVERVLDAGRSAGLTLQNILEPHFGEPEYRIMQSAGKAACFDEVSSVPAVLAVEWELR